MITCDSNCRDWIKIALSGLTIVSVLVAYLALRTNKKKISSDRIKDQDKEYLAQVERSLEWAYLALTDSGENIPARPDRLNWLASARYVLRAQRISSKISSTVYRTILDQVEDHWRQKFYVALDDPSLLNWTYYGDQSKPEWPENIEISSALVVVDFSNWKTGVQDPTDEVDRDKLMKSGGGLKGRQGHGLEDYIDRLNEIKSQRESSR